MAYVNGNDYFKMFVDLIDYSCQSAAELSKQFSNYNFSTLERHLDELHAIEHAADESKHAVMEKLSREFITPIEREDIIQLVQQIDDITDALEDVLIKMYMYCVKTVRPDALAFVDIVVRCCESIKRVFVEFRNYKKSKDLHVAIVEVNGLEEAGDKLYVKAVRRLFEECDNPLEVMAWTEVYNLLEKCCDLCEDAADAVEQIMMKNS